MVNNLDWTAPLSAIDFLRDVGKHFRVNRMLAKEAVSARLESDAGISYTEFSYQILQGMDFLELFRRLRVPRCSSAARDQWGNITAGVDLIRRVEGASVHALATPLVTKADGTKFGKTEGGALSGSTRRMTSPYAFYQFWLNAEDAKVGEYLRFFTFRSREEIEELERATAERPAGAGGAAGPGRGRHRPRARRARPGTGWRRPAAPCSAGATSRTLDAAVLADAVAELPTARVPRAPHLVVDLFAADRARREQVRRAPGGRRGRGLREQPQVDEEDAVVGPADLLHGGWVVLRPRQAVARGGRVHGDGRRPSRRVA